LDAGAFRVYDADGRERARHGRRGQGPGEFGATSQFIAWHGDSIGVTDPALRRISLFTEAGLARDFSIAAVTRSAAYPVIAPEGDRLAFSAGSFIGQAITLRFRAKYPLATWKPGETFDQMIVVRDSVPAAEHYLITHEGDPPGYHPPNFRRSTNYGVIGNRYVLLDNARPEIDVFDTGGRSERIIRFDVRDPPVSAVDRDSVMLRWKQFPHPTPRSAAWVAKATEQRHWFPPTRPALRWAGADAGGVWVVFHPPISTGEPLYVRVTPTGELSQCYRPSTTSRVAAFSRDRVVTVTERDEGDVVNVERTVAFPRN
jgi:hypothetical protein